MEEQKPLTQAELDAILVHRPADFSGRLLVGVSLSYDRALECSDFRGAVLRDCVINHCKLDNSRFDGADLGDTQFIRCRMEYCNFIGAKMDETVFDGCSFIGSCGLNGDTRLRSEVVFDEMMGMMRGVKSEYTPEWRQYAREICASDEGKYSAMLRDLQEEFSRINNAYPGMAAEIFNSGLRFLPHQLRSAANFIAQGNSVETAHKLATEDALPLNETLPERETFALPHSDVQKTLLEVRAFAAKIRGIPGTKIGMITDWLDLAGDLSDFTHNEAGYRQYIREYSEAFEQIHRRYDGVAAAMFNCEAGYLPGEMLAAAEWISGGGTAQEALEMAREGAFQPPEPEQDFGSMTMEM